MEDITSTPPAVPPEGGADKNRTKIIIMVAVVVLVLIAWQGIGRFTGEKMVERAMEQASGGDVDYDMNADGEGTITITGEEGEMYEYSAGGSVELPDSWPSDMPIIDGGQLSYAGSANPAEGESATMVSLTTTESMDAVASYYQKALTDNGWTVVSTVNMGATIMLAGSKDEREVGIYIAGEKGATAVTITISG